jgi:hypothetical protein
MLQYRCSHSCDSSVSAVNGHSRHIFLCHHVCIGQEDFQQAKYQVGRKFVLKNIFMDHTIVFRTEEYIF